MATTAANIDEYIDALPAEVQPTAQRIRQTILAVVPDAGEKISYQMPTITLAGESLLYFAVWKRHVGLYPIPRGDEAFEELIGPLRAAKDTVQLPLNKPIPYDVVHRITEFVVEQRLAPDG